MTVLALLLTIAALALPRAARADGSDPSDPTPAATEVATQVPTATDLQPSATPPPTATTPPIDTAVTDVPTASPEATSGNPAAALDLSAVTQALSDSGTVLVDGSGNPVPLAGQQAADALATMDPYIIRGGTTYRFLPLGGCAAYAGDGSVCSESATPVQAAIDAALPGETVVLQPGTYTEQLEISKDITLQGGPGVVLQAPSSLPLYYTTSANNHPIIYVHNTANAAILGLTVDGLEHGNGNYRFQGIGFYDAGGTIDGNTVLDITDNPFSGMQSGSAIYAYNADGTPRTLTVSDNTISNFQKSGITLNGSNLTVSVEGNTVTGAGPTAVIAQNGIQLGYGASGTVSDNTISGVDYTPGSWTSSGILLYAAGNGVQVTGNDLSGAQEGVAAASSNNVSITGNTIAGSSLDGIELADVSGATVSGNTISGSGAYGILIDGSSSGIGVTGNQLTANGLSGSDPSNGALAVTDATDPGSVTVQGNSFSGNATGVANTTTGDLTLVAAANWWGCAAGPGGAGCDGTYGNVTILPWLQDDPLAPAASGTTSVTPPTPAGTRWIPGTGGQFVDLACDQPLTELDFTADFRFVFSGLCGYQASVDLLGPALLPKALPDGRTFTTGVSVALLQGSTPVETTPKGTSMTIYWRLPQNQANQDHSILYWDAKANNHAGAWVVLPVKQANPLVPLQLYPDQPNDPRLVIRGVAVTQDGFLKVVVNFPGTFSVTTP